MSLFGKVGGMLLVGAAALAGNWVGDTVRVMTIGEPAQGLNLVHTTPEGHTVVGLNVTLTNFIPALLLALLAGRPRTLFAFVSGAVISALVGDGYERAVTGWLNARRSGAPNARLSY